MEEKQGINNIKEIIDENFAALVRQIQDVKTLGKINIKKTTSRHKTLRLLKNKSQDKIFEVF